MPEGAEWIEFKTWMDWIWSNAQQKNNKGNTSPCLEILVWLELPCTEKKVCRKEWNGSNLKLEWIESDLMRSSRIAKATQALAWKFWFGWSCHAQKRRYAGRSGMDRIWNLNGLNVIWCAAEEQQRQHQPLPAPASVLPVLSVTWNGAHSRNKDRWLETCFQVTFLVNRRHACLSWTPPVRAGTHICHGPQLYVLAHTYLLGTPTVRADTHIFVMDPNCTRWHTHIC